MMIKPIKIFGFVLLMMVMMASSCNSPRKTGRSKGCDCPEWSQAETETPTHEQGKV